MPDFRFITHYKLISKLINTPFYPISCTHLIYVCMFGLLSCAPPETPTEDPEEADLSVLHQFSGNVAVGIAAQFSQICNFDTPNICTRANRDGDYVLNDVIGNQGWLEADYIDSIGDTTLLRSAYFIESNVIDGIININPTTDIISQIWIANTQALDIDACMLEDCLTTTNPLINQSTIETIETNLSSVLRPFWPETLGSVRTSDYIADPNANELDLMHELINYVLDLENDNLEIWDNNNTLIASVPIEALVSVDFDPESGLYDMVLENEWEAATPFRREAPSGVPAITIALVINPSAYGQAPFTYEINTSATYSSLPNAVLSFEHIIISPDSSMSMWNETVHSGTLTGGGNHDVIVEVTADTGERAIRGAIIELERDDNTPATFGGDGSCRPELLEVNDLNICIELLDGGQIENCDENEQYEVVNNRCSRTSQLDGIFIGNCELVDNQLNRNHYQNPLRFTNETLAEQQVRLQAVCEADFGIWF